MIRFLRTVGLMWIGLATQNLFANAGTALRFNGANSLVSVTNDPALNAYPLTVSTWFRSQSGSAGPQVLASKYVNSSYNGWALLVQNGQLRGFYYANGSGNKAIDSTAGPVVTDGLWHHAALVVDDIGGRVFLDGVMISTNGWTGTAGPITTSVALTFGNLADMSIPLAGDLDEVTLWKRALTANEINYLKHRQLRGVEDGLVGYWKFDEGSDATAADATGHGFTGVLNSTAWVPSGATVPLSVVSTNCLKFAGTGDFVSVADAPGLNPFPLTTTAWVKTSRNSSQADGIVCKYVDGQFNGYAVFLLNGHVRAWYFKDGADYVYDGSLGLDGGFIADNDWHHVAFTVDASGGTLIVDGQTIQSLAWQGIPGAPTTNVAFQIGKYYTYPNTFLGQVDEVTLWNRALAASEIQLQKNLPLVGNESGLVAYYRMDEGVGTVAHDSTINAHVGMLTSNLLWVGSTAFLGDGATHLATSADYATLNRAFAIAGSPGQSAFTYNVSATVSRLYDYGAAPAAESVSGLLDYTLQTAPGGVDVPLKSSEASFTSSLGAYLASGPIPSSAASGKLIFATTANAEPNGVQLNSVDNLHQFSATLSLSENGGGYVVDQTATAAAARLFNFDGNLFGGSYRAAFTNLDATPVLNSVVVGDHLDVSITISTNAGIFPGFPGYAFGKGTPVDAWLAVNGDTSLQSSFFIANGPTNDVDTIQNLSFRRSNLFLTTNGLAGVLYMNLPLGFGLGLNDTSVRLATNIFPFVTFLNASLQPVTNSISIAGPLFFTAETLPCWILGSSMTWNIYQGQLVIPVTDTPFVRQMEDDMLTTNASVLTDTNAAHRISNDAYFRNAQINPSSPVFTITADANGVALVTGSIALQPPDLRPHFPYTDEQPGSEISTAQGILNLASTLVASNSYLNINSAVPVEYARDCSDTNCSAASIGPAIETLTTASSQLSFTPDGGLLGYGSVNDLAAPKVSSGIQLTWGYAGGKNFAQQTSTLLSGVYHMPGNFLRGDQTTLDGSQRPAALLFTGWGDDVNPSVLERPGTPGYANGLANYAGLNLRAPAQGRSYIAEVDTGLYPLTARAKYYIRPGGVSGIQEAASFPTNFSLYGYPFGFSSFRLSYLDSENWESRTDGQITFPMQPAGFVMEFQRMKFVCSGGLDNAQLPPLVSVKHLNYWNVDFKPQNIEFKPKQSEQCGTADRFLVLGAEVTMPFIKQPLDGALGFWPSGNLVTAADGIADGVDSRFAVPGQLSLQGTGTSSFPLSSASEGYFNNWDNPNKPETGFFNLAGRVRVPFFADMKVHLHLTPQSATLAQVDIMGGWPLAGGPGADQGWEEGANNFFNTAKFDTSANGWPQTLADVGDYRNSQTEQYHPRAQRNWHDVVFFNYPVSYNSVLHQFEGFQKAPVTLPIVDVDSNLKSLTPSIVDLDFSDNLNFALPKIKGLDFLSDAAGEINGPFNSLSNAIYGELQDISDKTGLSRGFMSLQRILRDDGTAFFGPILEDPLDAVAGNIVSTLATEQTTNPATVLNNVYSTVASANAGLLGSLSKISGTAGDINSVFGQVNQVFTNVDDTLGLLDRVLEKDDQGNRHVLRVIVEKLIQDQSSELNLPGALADSLDTSVVDDALSQVESSLEEIQSELTDLKQELEDAHSEFTSATGGISEVLTAVTNNAGEVQNFVQQSQANVSNLLATVLTPTGDYFSADPVAARAAIKQKLQDSFQGSTLESDYQKKFRQFFSDDSFVLDELLAVLTDKINSAVRSSVDNYLSGGGTGSIYTAMKGIGQMQQSMFTAKITGQPVFNNDSLRSIHLDAMIKLNLPNPMSFPVYMDIEELDSQTTNMGCIPGGDPAQEVILGAKNVPLQWPGAQGSADLTLTANARWTLQKGAVVGVGGLIEVDGNSSFAGCTIKTIGATFAIGETENYFAAKADATALIGPIPVEFKAGIFAGHACSLEPLIYIDPNCTNVLNNASGFTGIYIQYGGGVSLSQILFGTSSCALDLEAFISNAIFFEGDNDNLSLGIMQKESLEISLLCLISGEADFTEVGIATKTPSGFQLTLLGSAKLCGSAGPCPLCVKGCKTLTVKGILKQDGVDYSVDY